MSLGFPKRKAKLRLPPTATKEQIFRCWEAKRQTCHECKSLGQVMGKEFPTLSVTVNSGKWGRQGQEGHVQETGTSSSVVWILPHGAAGEEKVLGWPF